MLKKGRHYRLKVNAKENNKAHGEWAPEMDEMLENGCTFIRMDGRIARVKGRRRNWNLNPASLIITTNQKLND